MLIVGQQHVLQTWELSFIVEGTYIDWTTKAGKQICSGPTNPVTNRTSTLKQPKIDGFIAYEAYWNNAECLVVRIEVTLLKHSRFPSISHDRATSQQDALEQNSTTGLCSPLDLETTRPSASTSLLELPSLALHLGLL